MFWLRNKKIIFLIHTLTKGLFMMRLFCVIPVVDLDGMHHFIIAFGKTQASLKILVLSLYDS